MDESRRHAAKFLEKEIKTYLALASFFTKMGIKANLQVGGDKVQLSPSFYRERMKEAKEIVAELKGKARRGPIPSQSFRVPKAMRDPVDTTKQAFDKGV